MIKRPIKTGLQLKKLLDLPEETVRELEKQARGKRMLLKPYMETVLIEKAKYSSQRRDIVLPNKLWAELEDAAEAANKTLNDYISICLSSVIKK